MAKENIAKFYDAAMTDKALAAKVTALATEHGYDFTAAELLGLGVSLPISDDDAKKVVAAGTAFSCLGNYKIPKRHLSD